MEGSAPLVSIITPVYNRADCLAACINSVSTQADDTIEHVIVDDGSTDGSYDVAKELASKYSHVKVLRLDRNSGTNAARNLAVKNSRGCFVMLLDSDDALAPDAVSVVKEAIARNPSIKHFALAVDDRKAYYAGLGINEGSTRVFTFRDFLEERVGGDFAHVLLRETMLKYPFEEKIRVFEGINFLSFYKEASKILFLNHTVINRDRGRSDRVTYMLVPDSKESLWRHIRALRISLDNFSDDLLGTQRGQEILVKKLQRYYNFATLAGDYAGADYSASELGRFNTQPGKLYRTLRRLHLGPLFFIGAGMLLKLKYSIKKIE